jgi:hypothetical protein
MIIFKNLPIHDRSNHDQINKEKMWNPDYWKSLPFSMKAQWRLHISPPEKPRLQTQLGGRCL